MNKKNYEIVDSTEKLEKAIERVRQAQKNSLLLLRNKSIKYFLRRQLRQTRIEFPLQSSRSRKPAWAL